MTTKVTAEKTFTHLPQVPKGPRTNIESFLDQDSFACFAAAGKSALRDPEYLRSKVRQNLAKKLDKDSFVVLEGEDLKTYKLPLQGFFATIAYYFGYYHQNLGSGLSELSKKRTVEAIKFLQGEPPGTLIGFRDTCMRAHRFSQEVKGMHALLQKSEEKLARDTEELWFLARWICKLAQSILALFGGGSSEAVRIHNRWGLFQEEKGILEMLRRGQFTSTPNAKLGIRVGQTEITVKGERANYGVYALPYLHMPWETSKEGASFTGKVTFCLSRDGIDSAGWVSLCYEWNEKGSALLTSEGISYRPERPLVNRMLCITEIRDKRGREENNDLPIARKLVQLSVEIFSRQREERLAFRTNHDEAYIFCAAGFESEKDKNLKAKILAAREQGKKFPDYYDESSFQMYLYNSLKRPLLKTAVDFGEGATTWGAIIEKAPMLEPGTGPILPRFWHRDLFLLERR